MKGREARLGRELLGGGDSLAVERFRERLLSRMGLPHGKSRKALDLGCGDGLEAVYLARLGYKVEALDLEPHPKWPEVARRFRGRVRFRTGDAASLRKLKSGSYDLVFEKDVLHHVADPLPALKEMKRLVRPGGQLWVVECNRWNPVFYLHLTLLKGHEHFSRGRLRRLMDAAGLEGWKLKLVEARVWPWDSRGFQGLMEGLQDLAEKVPFFRPFLCYHLAHWTAPINIRKRP